MTACEILGRVPYREALATQFDLRTRRQRGEIADTVLILEHPKVITQGRRPAEQYLLCSPEELQSRGYDWLQVNRGGLLTYHGPGQLVAYFIVSLRERGWTVTEFVHRLEEILILTLEKFNLPAVRRTGFSGICLGDQKIASLGISVDRGVSMHGIALNIGTRLEDFDVIVPCGLDCSMTSMGAALSEEPDFSRVTEVFRDQVLQILP